MSKKKGPTLVAVPTRKSEVRRVRLISASVVSAISFGLYLVTLAPTVTLVDSGELILAAKTSGVAHPPGFPVYVMLAHLATYLPLGEAAVRVHLLSALCGSLAAGMMTMLSFEVLPGSNGDGLQDRIRSIAPPVFAGLLFGVSRTLWAYSTIAEVYTLNTLLIVAIFWLVFGWRNRFLSGEESYRRIFIAAFVFGVALGVHHVTVGLMLPALAVVVFFTAGFSFFSSRKFLYAGVSAFAGLAVYAYLPIAASQSPLMNWGDPQTFERFWWHISGRQYQTFFDFSVTRASEFGEFVAKEFGYIWFPAVLLIALAGLVRAMKRQRTTFWFLVLVILADLAYCLSYDIAEDKDAYYLPAFVAITVAAAMGANLLFDRLKNVRVSPSRIAIAAGCVALTLVAAVSFAANLPFNDRSQNYVAHDYVANMFKSVEPGGMLLTSDWQVYSPSLYVREVEGKRKDAIVLNINQLRRSWYFDYLEQAYPDLMAASLPKIGAYLEDLRAWEKDPATYSRNAVASQRLNSRFFEMILAMVESQKARGSLYVTTEIATTRGGQDVELTRALMERYKFVPKGIVFGVVEKGGPDDLGDPVLTLRGMNDGTIKFDDDDVTKKKVRPVYLSMLMNSGMNLASLGRQERAIARFKQVLSIDPELESAKKALASSQSAIQGTQQK